MAKTDNLTDFLTDVANAIRNKKGTTDKINPQNFSSEIESIQTGGEVCVEKDVNFWDHQGNLLHSYTIKEAQSLTELPEGPVYDNGIYEFKTWTHDLTAINSTQCCLDVFAVCRKVGVQYSYASLFYFNIYAGQTLKLTCYVKSSYAHTIDWGDGSPQESLGTSYSTYMSHTYTKPGKYTVAILSSTSSQGLKIGYDQSNRFIYDAANRNSLLSFVIPENDYYTTVNQYAFSECMNLKKAYTYKTGNYTFNGCYLLEVANMYEVYTSTLNLCYAIKRLNLDGSGMTKGITSNCMNLTKLEYSASSMYVNIPPRLKTLVLTNSSMTTLASAAEIPCSTYGTKIFVPDSLVETYKADTKWSEYTDYIYGISEITEDDLNV